MRSLALALALVVPALVAVDAHPTSSLEAPVKGPFRVIALRPDAPCFVWPTVEQIARVAGIRVGFEHPAGCPPYGRSRNAGPNAIVMDGWSPRQALDFVTDKYPQFAWREIDDVAVMRPMAAWTDASNVLHRRVTAWSASQVHPHHALHALLQHASPSLFLDHTDVNISPEGTRLDGPARLIDEPIDVEFAGGPLLRAVSAVAERLHANWELGYAGKPHVTLYAPDYDGGETGLSMRPLPPAQR